MILKKIIAKNGSFFIYYDRISFMAYLKGFRKYKDNHFIALYRAGELNDMSGIVNSSIGAVLGLSIYSLINNLSNYSMSVFNYLIWCIGITLCYILYFVLLQLFLKKDINKCNNIKEVVIKINPIDDLSEQKNKDYNFFSLIFVIATFVLTLIFMVINLHVISLVLYSFLLFGLYNYFFSLPTSKLFNYQVLKNNK